MSTEELDDMSSEPLGFAARGPFAIFEEWPAFLPLLGEADLVDVICSRPILVIGLIDLTLVYGSVLGSARYLWWGKIGRI